jgi:hypothetical protein
VLSVCFEQGSPSQSNNHNPLNNISSKYSLHLKKFTENSMIPNSAQRYDSGSMHDRVHELKTPDSFKSLIQMDKKLK